MSQRASIRNETSERIGESLAGSNFAHDSSYTRRTEALNAKIDLSML